MALKLGRRFKTFSELAQTVEKYKTIQLNEYYIRDCRTIGSQKKRSPDTVQKLSAANIEDLRYYQIRYACIHGGRPYRNTGKNKSNRQTMTFKKGCRAGFFIKLCGESLEIKELIEEHCHETSLATFRTLFRQRLKLPEDIKTEVESSLSKGMAKIQKQGDVIPKTGCQITLKDLTNFNNKVEKEKSFKDCVKMLQNIYNCDIEVLLRENNSMKALYFQDTQMKKCFQDFPEILFMGGNYCLLDNKTSCYILLIEDSNGNSEVIAVCFMFEEYLENINWFIETFKLHNIQWEKTKIIMTDKDAKERTVLKKSFPNMHLIITLAHVNQTFKRDISKKKIIKGDEITLSRDFLQRLAQCKSPDQYDETYNEFKTKVPDCVVHYYNKTWHPIREQWVIGFTYYKSDNRLERANSKLKHALKRYSNLEMCLQNLFVVINSIRLEADTKTAEITHKVRTSASISTAAKQFEKLLTPYAFTIVEEFLNKIYKEGTLTNVGDDVFLFKKTDLLLEVTPRTCECLFWNFMGLPCEHIFECRRLLNLQPFDESLCWERWKNSYFRLHQRVYQLPDTKSNGNSTNSEICNDIAKLAKLTQQQKLKIMQNECFKLSQLGAETEGKKFMHRYQTIKSIVETWSKGKEILISNFEGTFQEIEQPSQEIDIPSQENLEVASTCNVIDEEHNYYFQTQDTNSKPETNRSEVAYFIAESVDVADDTTSILSDDEADNMSSDIEFYSEVITPSKRQKRGQPSDCTNKVGPPCKKIRINKNII